MRAVLALIVLLALAVAPVGALDGARSAFAGARLVDERRREITLRGVNARVEGVFAGASSTGRARSAGGERIGRTTALSRVYARAVPGRVLEHTFDAGANTLRLRYAARGTAPLELFVPARRFPGGFALSCDGTPVAAPPGPVVTLRCGPGRGEHLVELIPAS